MMEEVEQKDKTDFFCIPAEVIDGYMLPHLGWNDLRQLREVCTWTYALVHDFMRLHELSPELEYNQVDKTFAGFWKTDIPTTRIFLNNSSGEEFYNKAGKSGAKFLKRCGPQVKHLRVVEFTPTCCKELAFLDCFVNLETFQSERFGKVKRSSGSGGHPDAKHIPKSFYHLKEIKIGNNKAFIIPNVLQLTEAILKVCLQLERITLPFNEHSAGAPPTFFPVLEPDSMARAFDLFRTSLEEQGTLKIIDFDNYHSVRRYNQIPLLRLGSPSFLELCAACLKHNVKLLNVGADWFDNWGDRFGDRNADPPEPQLGKPVYSMVNLHPYALQVEMPNLEKIEIRSSRRSCPGPPERCVDLRPDWPALKILDITIDSDRSGCQEFHPEDGSFSEMLFCNGIIYRCLFDNVSRPALTELRFNFVHDADEDTQPQTEEIVSSCPNLKKLTLVNWPGTNAGLTKLWIGLPALEEVSLEDCRHLGNAAFLGEGIGGHVFLRLSNLKKLSLKGLDEMPKVTDTLFSHVIRHMPLTHLTLTSSLPLKSVTLTGVRSLLDGKFAESMEKFSFEGWSLANVSSKKWTQLKSKFRSSSML